VRRRDFITLLGGAAVAWPLAARAQQPAMPVIGILNGQSPNTYAPFMAAVRQGLNETGYIEGQNVAIEYRWADSHLDRLPSMAADLVGRKVAVMLAGGSTVAVRAAMAATQTIPIVFTTALDPVAAGYVASFNRPSGNVTGVTLVSSELVPKRLNLLRELVATATKIAFLTDPNNPDTFKYEAQAVQESARRIGLEAFVVGVGTKNEIEGAFAAALRQGSDALLVGSDAIFVSVRSQIAALALRHAIPVAFSEREGAAAGGLMSYGASQTDVFRQAGNYVGQILKGVKPTNLPILQPTKFELVINLSTAKALGITPSRQMCSHSPTR
jgi:putative ABC transport system substrate-binding protein